MITITIGSSSRTLGNADPSWINQQVNARRRDGTNVCVQVRIQEDGADVALATPECASGFGGGRRANPLEQRIFDLWAKHRLNAKDFTGGDLVALLHQLERVA